MRKRRSRVGVACASLLALLIPGVAQADSTPSVQVTATPLDGLSVSVSVADPVSGGTYTIDWGDGSTSAGGNGSGTHPYQYPGVYTITETLSAPSVGSVTGSTSFKTAGSFYSPLGPERILDTRHGIGAPAAKIPAGGVVRVNVADIPWMSPDVTAVAVNLTAVDGTAAGFVTGYADNTSVPDVSNLNYGVGAPVANFAILQVGTDGYFDLRNSSATGSSVDLIADLAGFFSRTDFTAGTFPAGLTSITPTRFVDTRHGIGSPKAQVSGHGTLHAYVEGGANQSVGAVSLHVTVVNATAGGYLSVAPPEASATTASTLNFLAGQTVSNTVIVPINADGLDFYNASSKPVDVIVDVNGYYFDTGSSGSELGYPYIPITPQRLYDSRATTPVRSNVEQDVLIASASQVSPRAQALAMNLTATQGTANGYLDAAPVYVGSSSGQPATSTSSVNYRAGQTVPCFAQAPLSGLVAPKDMPVANVESGGSVEMIMDVFGYYTVD